MKNQTPTIIALGPKLTYSDLQIPHFQKIIPKTKNQRPKILLKNFSQIIKTLKENPQHLAVVPLENSIQGDVTEVLDAIYQQDFKILAGHWQPIHLALCGTKKVDEKNYKNITKIFSHPQPLSQAKKFLNKNFPNAEKIEMTSTAEAIRYIAKKNDKNYLAVGPKEAGEFFNLEILAENIESSKNNQTFFVLIENVSLQNSSSLRGGTEQRRSNLENFKQEFSEKNNILNIVEQSLSQKKYETALAFTFHADKPSSLFSVLEIFAKKEINLTKIVSRPTGEKRYDYIFYLNFEGKISEKLELFENIKSQTKNLKILGEYFVF
ncbi:MAG: hypothetical protein KAT32_04110 [Candidatus Moranbacteria bacterium]|nr:hypothetical protein [Candidatus Moranbacteria bacterium]